MADLVNNQEVPIGARALSITSLVAISVAWLASEVPAVEIGEKDNGWSICEERALNLYAQGHKAGLNVGRNLVDDGKLTKSGAVPLTNGEACEWADRLDLALHPPAPEPVSNESAVTPSTYSASGTGWDAVAACESGGDWSINTGNGYYGGLQFDSGTWDAYGDPSCAEASDCSPGAQIDAANRMPYDGWPNC